MSEAPDQGTGASVAGRTITAALLLGLAVMFGWFLAGGNQPSQGAFLEDCRTEAQPNYRAEQNEKHPNNSLITTEHKKSESDNQSSTNEDEKAKSDRRLAEYTCQLAIYTAQLASFTHWLFIATIGLALVGLWQGINIERSVSVANRAADEARDAIIATQATASAANTHVRAAQEANLINREALVAANRPWIKVEIRIPEDEPVIFTSEEIEATVSIRIQNIGRSPATRINLRIEFYPDLKSADDRVKSLYEIHMPSAGFSGYGRMLFPDADFTENRTVSTSAAKFKERIGKPS